MIRELKQTEHGLVLTDGEMEIRADFDKMKKRVKKGTVFSELLVKAAKIKNHKEGETLTAVDMTAGFGEDSILLAAAGFEVTMFEYNQTISALLKDCLLRSENDPDLAPIVSRMKLVPGDSRELGKTLDFTPDVVYLDPMFPEREKSALIKKKFQLLHGVEAPCSDDEGMLRAAKEMNPRKIVVKRPVKGPFLAGMKPDYQIAGKAVRYDVYVFARETDSKE